MRKIFVWMALLVLCGSSHGQMFQGQQLVEPALLSSVTSIVPGQPFTVGLRLHMQPGWHTYWRYPGDAGMPTRIDWQLPAGFKAGPIQWPNPEKVVEPGDLWTYAYRDEVLLLVEITPPAQFPDSSALTLRAHAHWLVCEKICVPGDAELTLELPAGSVNAPANDALFAKTGAQLPVAGAPPFHTKWSRTKDVLELELTGLPATAGLDFFPLPDEATTIGHPMRNGTKITLPLLGKTAAKSIDGLVVLSENGTVRGWLLSAPASRAPLASSPLAVWLLLGFAGGLILNVMPCVLPVIALKIFGFIKQAGESPARILGLGLAFVAGIFAWFLSLAALVAAFKSAGHELNWAFQFQHPAFLIAMIVIIFVFALNLLGAFEIILPGRAQNRIADLSAREGYGGAFLHGVFATLMATPCTAPFLGPALGFAFAQPPAIIFVMFGAIATGMSAPYLVLAFKPGWLRFLPKPGMWMVRVKQLMGVLLLGTVAWLGWVLYQQQTTTSEPFAPTLEAALHQGRPVFVDFTADWCVNCKVNERLVLTTGVVQKAFDENHVIFLKADWTNGDEDITKLLRQFGRVGVPLYVLYPARGEPIVLPEIITKQIVLDALKSGQD